MSQGKVCLLCNTENTKYDNEFLAQRAYFSAPKLQDLRTKWNEAISRIHPVLQHFVTNVDTYKVCDLHFKESDIKKTYVDKLSNEDVCLLPVSNWGLKLKAVPLSTAELKSEKSQNSSTNEKMTKEMEIEIEKVAMKENYRNENESRAQNNNETKKCFSNKADGPKNSQILEEKKSTLRPIRPSQEKPGLKFSPYSMNKEENSKVQQMLLKPCKNQIIFVPSGSNTFPISPSINPVLNSGNSPVSSLSSNSVPQFISLSRVSSLSSNCSAKVISIKQVSSIPKIPTKVSTVPKVTVVQSKVVKTSPVFQISKFSSVPKSSIASTISTVSKSSSVTSVKEAVMIPEKIIIPVSPSTVVPTIQMRTKINSPLVTPPLISNVGKRKIKPYRRDELMADLVKNPLPSEWAYKIEEENILFTQYSTVRKFPIFCKVSNDLKTEISLGHQDVKFIPYSVNLKSFLDVSNCLQKLESAKWCLGIGFDNNHSDSCLVLTIKLNTRCITCRTVRQNAEKQEVQQINQRKKPEELRLLIRNLRRKNSRMEAKVSKLKLMVTHLKTKQCADCLHEKFVQKTLTQTDSESSNSKK